MKIVVIGANGYFGPKLIDYFHKQYHDVAVVVRSDKHLVSPHRTLITEEFNEAELRTFYNEFQPDAIVNLAWMGSTGDLRNCKETQIANVDFVYNHAELARDLKIPYYFAGSIAQKVNNHETLYGEYKLKITQMLKDCKNSTCLMLANICGGEDLTNRFLIALMTKFHNNEEVKINTTGTQNLSVISAETASLLINERIYRNHTENYDNDELFVGTEPKEVKWILENIHTIIDSKSKLEFGTNIVQSMNLDDVNLSHVNSTAYEELKIIVQSTSF